MGTSLLPFGNLYYLRDHPHAYGDKKRITLCMALGLGSSPRVWGQVLTSTLLSLYSRIIPTRMGTSLHPFCEICMIVYHPHAYGDKLSGAFFQANFLGSSPRVWGQVLSSLRDFLPYRIIPMRMGTSLLITLGQQTL